MIGFIFPPPVALTALMGLPDWLIYTYYGIYILAALVVLWIAIGALRS